jgi:predicted esterase
VPIRWAKSGYDKLKQRGIKIEFVEYPNLEHAMDIEQIDDVISWISKVLK